MIDVASAEGSYIYDQSGKKYLDLISGIAVSNIGHRHPQVVKAIKDQLDQYMHVMAYGEFIQSPQNNLALALNEILPAGLDTSYFVNSGAEAIEGSLKLAKRVTGRTEIISCRGSYHGSTHGALSISGNETKKYAFRPLLPDVRFIKHNCMHGLDQISQQTAAVVIELIQGDAGVRIANESYVQALREVCNQTGAQLIVDEIQTGMGRTGQWFSFMHYGIIPDIIAIAKGFGGGMPIGAFISSKKKMQLLTHDPMLGHITTFGGHPVNCAAALANLQVIKNEQLIDEVERKGQLLEEALAHQAIVEIRRKGLMLAIEFESADLVQHIVEKCLNKGVITFWFLSCPNSFRLAPPLNITIEELINGAGLIQEAINESVS